MDRVASGLGATNLRRRYLLAMQEQRKYVLGLDSIEFFPGIRELFFLLFLF
jgi:hypothetical protein